jgi:hypothetical protein
LTPAPAGHGRYCADGRQATAPQQLLEFVGEAYSFDGLVEFRAGLLEVLA